MRRLLLVALAGLLLCAAPAGAATRAEIYKDCTNGQLSGSYTAAELRDARQNMPADVEEYTRCGDVLRRAEQAPQAQPTAAPTQAPPTTGGTSGGGGGGGGAAPAQTPEATPTPPAVPQNPQDLAAVQGSAGAGDQPLSVGGAEIVPVSAVGQGRDGNDLPPVLIVALVLLAIAGVALSVPPVRRRLRFKRS